METAQAIEQRIQAVTLVAVEMEHAVELHRDGDGWIRRSYDEDEDGLLTGDEIEKRVTSLATEVREYAEMYALAEVNTNDLSIPELYLWLRHVLPPDHDLLEWLAEEAADG